MKIENERKMQHLPQEIFYQVISFIDTSTLDKSIQLVSIEFRAICQYVRKQRPGTLIASEFEAIEPQAIQVDQSSNTMISKPSKEDWFVAVYNRCMKERKNYKFKVRINTISNSNNSYRIAVGVVTHDYDKSGDEGFLKKNCAFTMILMNGNKCCGRHTATTYYETNGKRLSDGTVITVILKTGSLYFEVNGVPVGVAYQLPKVVLRPAIFFHGSNHSVTFL
jgi:hypothetical protein